MKFISLNQLPLQTDDFHFRHLDNLTERDALVIHNPSDAFVVSPVLLKSSKTLEDHIELIRNNSLNKAIVVAKDIQFLSKCPSIEYLWVLPAVTVKEFDYSPLYKLPNIKWLRCDTTTGLNDELVASVDYSQLKNLKYLCINGPGGHNNVAAAGDIASLIFDKGFPNARTLHNTIPGTALLNLALCQAPILTLDGIESACHLQRLELSYNRKLVDISALRYLKDSLAYLEIDTCGKITDFSVLYELYNLEFLILKGSNIIPDLSFLKNMPKLKHLQLSMNVLNGDLSMCKNLPYVKIKNRNHYSLKDKDLKKTFVDPDTTYPFIVF